jgi:hypothetical protein
MRKIGIDTAFRRNNQGQEQRYPTQKITPKNPII